MKPRVLRNVAFLNIANWAEIAAVHLYENPAKNLTEVPVHIFTEQDAFLQFALIIMTSWLYILSQENDQEAST